VTKAALSYLSALFVIARNSTFAYKSKTCVLRQLDRIVCVTSRAARERDSWSRPKSVAAMIQRFAHVCFRKLGSIINSPGATLPMNIGRSVCDLNRHTLSSFNTHSLIKSATIGGFD
jgi:hypothetical protein